MADYSLVVPAYNEAKRIGETIRAYRKEWDYRLGSIGKTYEVIVVLNGCTDSTRSILRNLALSSSLSSSLRIVELHKANKGLAVLEGFRASHGSILGFTDADGAIPPLVMLKIMQLAEEGKVVIGSKYLPEATCNCRQSRMRQLASRCWCLLVRLVLGLRVTDTQAGAKAMPVEYARRISDRVLPCNFAFDVSLLWQAQRAGYGIIEVPLIWRHINGSKFNLIKEVPRMFLALLRLRIWSGHGYTAVEGVERQWCNRVEQVGHR
jgi:glycosyltransferase involved in cell wall biosynthesis